MEIAITLKGIVKKLLNNVYINAKTKKTITPFEIESMKGISLNLNGFAE
jgi:hypothetical protein